MFNYNILFAGSARKKVWASSMNSILGHRQTPSNSVQESAHTYGMGIRLIHGSLILKFGDFQDLPVQSKRFISMSFTIEIALDNLTKIILFDKNN